MEEEKPKYQYLFGGGFSKGPMPLHRRLTDAQFTEILDKMAEGVPMIAAFQSVVTCHEDTITDTRKRGKEALKKWESGAELDENEMSLMRFRALTDMAQGKKIEKLVHRAQCNHVTYKALDGTIRIADPMGARQAILLLSHIPAAREPVETDVAAPEVAAKLTEAEQAAFVRDYLAKRGLPYPEQDGYDPESAAPANERK